MIHHAPDETLPEIIYLDDDDVLDLIFACDSQVELRSDWLEALIAELRAHRDWTPALEAAIAALVLQFAEDSSDIRDGIVSILRGEER